MKTDGVPVMPARLPSRESLSTKDFHLCVDSASLKRPMFSPISWA